MWYYMQDGAQQGPVSDDELQSLARDGRLQPTDMVWRSGMAEWQQANQVPTLPFSAPAVPEAAAAPTFEAATKQSVVETQSADDMPTASAPTVEATPSPYGASPAQYGGSATDNRSMTGGGTGGAQVPDYLVWSILATFFCCQISGIVSIIYSSKANSFKVAGSIQDALEAAKTAKLWLMISLGIGVLTWGGGLLYFLLVVVAAASGV